MPAPDRRAQPARRTVDLAVAWGEKVSRSVRYLTLLILVTGAEYHRG
jgi:hypothetical protein